MFLCGLKLNLRWWFSGPNIEAVWITRTKSNIAESRIWLSFVLALLSDLYCDSQFHKREILAKLAWYRAEYKEGKKDEKDRHDRGVRWNIDGRQAEIDGARVARARIDWQRRVEELMKATHSLHHFKQPEAVVRTIWKLLGSRCYWGWPVRSLSCYGNLAGHGVLCGQKKFHYLHIVATGCLLFLLQVARDHEILTMISHYHFWILFGITSLVATLPANYNAATSSPGKYQVAY